VTFLIDFLDGFIILNTPQLCCGDKGHTYSTDVCFSSTGFRYHAAAPRMPRSSAARVRRRRFTLRMKLTRLVINAELNKRYSVEGLLTELEKIKIMILPDGEKITTEITKKQREILDTLHMCA
jgi:hypothetical protein